MHTVVRPPWGRRFTCRYPGGWIAETTLRLRVAGAPCGRYFQASRGDGIRVRMAGLARGHGYHPPETLESIVRTARQRPATLASFRLSNPRGSGRRNVSPTAVVPPCA